mgnify:CR=1 FL=1
MVVMVHNGIIENYQELRDHLTQKGYTFYSETDTEGSSEAIAYYYEKTDHNPLEVCQEHFFVFVVLSHWGLCLKIAQVLFMQHVRTVH